MAGLTNNEKRLLRWRLARCSEISRSALNWGLSGPKFQTQHRPLEAAGSVPEVHPSYAPCHLATKTRGDKQARVCRDTARLFICMWPAASLTTRREPSPAQTRLQRCRPGVWRAGLTRGAWVRCRPASPLCGRVPSPSSARSSSFGTLSVVPLAGGQANESRLPPSQWDETFPQASGQCRRFHWGAILGTSGAFSKQHSRSLGPNITSSKWGQTPEMVCFENEANTDPEKGTALRAGQSCVGGVGVRARRGGMR